MSISLSVGEKSIIIKQLITLNSGFLEGKVVKYPLKHPTKFHENFNEYHVVEQNSNPYGILYSVNNKMKKINMRKKVRKR